VTQAIERILMVRFETACRKISRNDDFKR